MIKNIYLLILCFILYNNYIIAGDTAYPIENGQRQMGVFQPRIYGMNNNIEISTHPLLFFVKPNIKVKKYHGEMKGFGIASRYSFDYPTPLLKLIQRKGKFGILSKDPDIGDIPSLFVFQGELLTTKKLDKSSITGKIGLSFCPGCEIDSRHLVDLPLAYPRMLVYEKGLSTNIGLDYYYKYSEKVSLKTDIDLFIIPDKDVFIENKFIIEYQFSPKYTLTGGFKLTQGTYPFGKQLDIFPLIDLSWSWEK
ncbi:MAG: hypothetical protein H8E85_01560 [Candidatus Marinimicrobia bacterium]|nr:hypothetical protein [Candidatus Neomarinimicrobiota bacterium]